MLCMPVLPPSNDPRALPLATLRRRLSICWSSSDRSSARCTMTVSSSVLTGLVRNWYAPSWIACTAVRTSAWPVSTMTGSSGQMTFSRCSTSSPLMPGSPRSSTTISGGSLATSCSAVGPSCTTVTPRPGVSRNRAVRMRPCIGSSSTDSSRRRVSGRVNAIGGDGVSVGDPPSSRAGFVPSIAIPLQARVCIDVTPRNRRRRPQGRYLGARSRHHRNEQPRDPQSGLAAAVRRRMVEAARSSLCAIAADGAILER